MRGKSILGVAILLAIAGISFGQADGGSAEWMVKYRTLDFEKCSLDELRLLRNEIYARHGRKFRSKKLRKYFKAQPWYRPDPHFSEDRLSPLEKNWVAKALARETPKYSVDYSRTNSTQHGYFHFNLKGGFFGVREFKFRGSEKTLAEMRIQTPGGDMDMDNIEVRWNKGQNKVGLFFEGKLIAAIDINTKKKYDAGLAEIPKDVSAEFKRSWLEPGL